jgi:N-ethylmaleimide reductase
LNDIVEHETEAVYAAVVGGLAPLGLTYLHVVEGPAAVTARSARRGRGCSSSTPPSPGRPRRRREPQGVLEDGPADLVALGRAFIANIDYPVLERAA